METKIKIVHQPDVPDTLIERFIAQANLENVEVVNQGNIEHFEDIGETVYSVALWFSNHGSDFAVGLLGTAFYDTLSKSLKFLFAAFKKLREGKPNSSTKPLAIILDGKTYRLKVAFEETLSIDDSQKAIHALESFLKDHGYKIYINNSDYFSDDLKPTIEFNYNLEKNLWLPINAKENKAFFIKAGEDARNLLH